MSPTLVLRVVTYLLVADGLVALFLAGLIGPTGATLVLLGMLAAWWLEAARQGGVVRPVVTWILVGAAAVAIAIDLVFLAGSVLDGMVHLLLVLILARLLLRRALGDLKDAGLLCFFLLVATSAATFSVGFLFLFVVFLLLGTWMLVLQHVVGEMERATGQPVGAGARLAGARPLMRIGLVGAAATFAVASILFFVIPRVGQAALPLRGHITRMVTGFADRVELGAFGEIETDKTVVMRVYPGEDIDEPSLLPNLRWRGIVFDRFDGRTWAVGQPDRMVVRRGVGGQFQVGMPLGRGPTLRQDIYLDPIGTDIVFAAPQPVRMEARAGTVTVDEMGSVSIPTATARLHYQVDSELEGAPAPFTRVRGAGTAFSAAQLERYLQLPPLSPRIGELAQEVAADSRDPYEAAGKLSQYLSSRFHYTLAKPQTASEPLEEFLFVRRSGNCEYFAAALAVMLRTLGIPARVVGGFQRGEWNPYGRYFMVRLSDAHAWVEAHFDGLGWVTLDPSPRAATETLTRPSPAALYFDAVRMYWYRYVINWSFRDQRVFASTFQRQAHDMSLAVGWSGRWPKRAWLIVPALPMLAAVLGWAIWRLARRARTRRPTRRPPRFYERALRSLARRGLAPEPAETARQFWNRVRVHAPGCAAPLRHITAEYERTRFGSVPLTDDNMREIERCLLALGRK